MSVWQPVESRGKAKLWERPGQTGQRFFVTQDGASAAELPGREQGYPTPELAWEAFRVRDSIAREIDINQ